MGAAFHEVVGVGLAIIAGAVVVASLSKGANTSGVLDSTFNGFKGIVDAITAPVRGSA
jgi:hypothetical protein